MSRRYGPVVSAVSQVQSPASSYSFAFSTGFIRIVNSMALPHVQRPSAVEVAVLNAFRPASADGVSTVYALVESVSDY